MSDRYVLRIQPVDATLLLLLAHSLVCCIHRLNPQAKAAVRCRRERRVNFG